MKKIITLLAVVGLVVGAQAKFRFLEGQPTSDVYSISITDDGTRLSSISCLVAGTETNSYTITYVSEEDSQTYVYAPAITDVIGGGASDGVKNIYNSDQDTTTLHTEWLKKGDTLKLTSNDGAQTDETNVYYRVVLEVAE
jgi:hypothetical protein